MKTPIVRPSPGRVRFQAVLRPGEDAWLESQILGLETHDGEETDPDDYELWWAKGVGYSAVKLKESLETHGDEVVVFDTTGAKPMLNVLAFRPLPSGVAPESWSPTDTTPAGGIKGWTEVVIAKTRAHEGDFGSCQRNLDGQGLSYGILQWTQRGGGLHVVLSAMAEADRAAFARIFGPLAGELLDHTAKKALTPLGGAVLWDEPWLSRFKAAGKHIPFQQAQLAAAANSSYMKAAAQIAELLNLRTERAMAIYFNRAVHQGPSSALKDARSLVQQWGSGALPRPATEREALAQYGAVCASKFLRATPPESPWFNAARTIRWVERSRSSELLPDGSLKARTGRFWHATSGPLDLHEGILSRTASLLGDPELRDQPVDLRSA